MSIVLQTQTCLCVCLLQDMDLVPLLIQENYLNHKPAACGNDLQHMKVRYLHLT
jgi:hypothetical protein